MAKYDIYKNKRNRFHPSIEIEMKEDGTWLNYEITDSPVQGETFIQLNVNPNVLSKPGEISFVRKYLRKDKIRHRGDKLSHYMLSFEDKVLIENMLVERDGNIKKLNASIQEKNKNGVKRLDHKNGNPANRHRSAETPSKYIKPSHRRKHKKK